MKADVSKLLHEAEALLAEAEPEIGQAMGPDQLALHQAQLKLARAHLAILVTMEVRTWLPASPPLAQVDAGRCSVVRLDWAAPPHGPQCTLRRNHDGEDHAWEWEDRRT